MRLTGGVPQDVVLELPRDRIGDAVAVAWSQPNDAALWQLEIHVETRAGRRRLGYVSPLPRGGSKIVAIASCPGAEGWIVTAYGPPGACAELELSSSPPTEGMAPGVVELDRAGRALGRTPRLVHRFGLTTGFEHLRGIPTRLDRVRGVMGPDSGYVQVWDTSLVPTPSDRPFRVTAAAAGCPFELLDGGIYPALSFTVSSDPVAWVVGPKAWIEVDYE